MERCDTNCKITQSKTCNIILKIHSMEFKYLTHIRTWIPGSGIRIRNNGHEARRPSKIMLNTIKVTYTYVHLAENHLETRLKRCQKPCTNRNNTNVEILTAVRNHTKNGKLCR